MVPFLIEDETPREERVPARTRHQNQVTGIGTLTIAVDELTTVRRWYAAILGDGGQEIERAELEAVGARFTLGPQGFDFLTPKGSAGALSGWLRDRGPSPYAVTLRTASGKPRLLEAPKGL